MVSWICDSVKRHLWHRHRSSESTQIHCKISGSSAAYTLLNDWKNEKKTAVKFYVWRLVISITENLKIHQKHSCSRSHWRDYISSQILISTSVRAALRLYAAEKLRTEKKVGVEERKKNLEGLTLTWSLRQLDVNDVPKAILAEFVKRCVFRHLMLFSELIFVSASCTEGSDAI